MPFFSAQLERQELQAALLLYMKSLARVIPTVVSYQFKGMGRLVDSDQIKEEIVAVVDEVRRASIVAHSVPCLCWFRTSRQHVQ